MTPTMSSLDRVIGRKRRLDLYVESIGCVVDQRKECGCNDSTENYQRRKP